MKMPDIAKHLRDRGGLSVLPIKFKSKEPAIKSWKELQTRKATDQEIAQWFQDPINIGVICGDVSDRLCVLDFDEMEAYCAWASHVHFPTLSVKTGKGRHCYYRLTEGAPNNGKFTVNGQYAGEIRYNGGYVVCPPSVHPSGARYTWDKYLLRDVKWDWLEITPANVRPCQATIPTAEHPKAYYDQALNGEVDKILKSAEGSRNETLFRSALKLKKYLEQVGETTIRTRLIAAGKHVGLPEAECQRTIASAFSY